ncbi:MAG: T9SS type A sorting domain-containing protein [Candidatus Kapaibacterium sp.]
MKTIHFFNKVALFLLSIVLVSGVAYSQANTSVDLTVTDNGGSTRTLEFGVNTAATNGIDGSLSEVSLPPFPPSGVFEARFVSHGSGTLGQGSPADYRPSTSSTQTDLYKVKFQVSSAGGYPVTISWSSSSVASQYGFATLTDPFGGAVIGTIDMRTTGQVVITNAAITEVVIETHDPVGAATGISISGCPLNFGLVQIPTPGVATQSLTIENLGSTAIVVDSITSSNVDFAISAPTSFPQSVTTTPLQVDVTYTASGAGAASSTITIYYDGSSTTTCNATALASSGEGLYFVTTLDSAMDNSNAHSTNIGLKYSGTTPAQGIQFKINVPNNLKRIKSIGLGSAITTPSDWSFDYEIERATSGSEVTVVLYGNSTAINLPVNTDNLFVVHFDVSDIKLCNGAEGGDDTTAVMYLSDVQSALATDLGEPAGIGVDANRDSTVCYIYNGSARGDVNCDDHVDVLDLLEINDVILNRGTFASWQFNRADLAEWSSVWASGAVFTDANNYGDNVVNVQDLVLITNAILNEEWPDTDVLRKIESDDEGSNGTATAGEPQAEAFAKENGIFDVKFTYEVANSGITVKMNNVVPVKGYQMKLKASDVPSDLSVLLDSGIETPFKISHLVVGDEIRIVAITSNGDPIQPMNGNLMEMPFAISNPNIVAVIEPITVGGQNNQSLKVEWEILTKVSSVDASETKNTLALENVPNPFTGSTTIRFTLPESGATTLVVTDVAGKEVARLLENSFKSAGEQSVEFDGSKLSSGVYFYTLTANGQSVTRRLVLAN